MKINNGSYFLSTKNVKHDKRYLSVDTNMTHIKKHILLFVITFLFRANNSKIFGYSTGCLLLMKKKLLN